MTDYNAEFEQLANSLQKDKDFKNRLKVAESGLDLEAGLKRSTDAFSSLGSSIRRYLSAMWFASGILLGTALTVLIFSLGRLI